MDRLFRLIVVGAALAAGLLPGAATSAPEPPAHAAITIASDADFQACACVTGSGTARDPYVIGPWTIKAPSTGGWALKVDNSAGSVTKFFRVAGIVAAYNDLTPTDSVVWLVKVSNATAVDNVSASSTASVFVSIRWRTSR